MSGDKLLGSSRYSIVQFARERSADISVGWEKKGQLAPRKRNSVSDISYNVKWREKGAKVDSKQTVNKFHPNFLPPIKRSNAQEYF